MRLEKVRNRNRGYNIYLIIANREYGSHWTSPPKSVDHADLGYLQDRYPKINTNIRMNQFKELYKNLWIEVTENQKDIMKHCIGLNYKKKPYRNYFFTSYKNEEWNDLVTKGLAIKSTKEPDRYDCVYFWLSKQGVEFILNKSISDKVYNEL